MRAAMKEHNIPESDLNKVPEAAKQLRKADKTLWAWIAQRKIATVRVGRNVFIPQSEIDRLLTEGYTPAREAA